MSKGKKKKVVVTTENTNSKNKPKPTASKIAKSSSTVKSNAGQTANVEMLFGRENYKWMLIGVAFILIGMLLMLGGNMPSPDVWDESLIYGFRRTVLAPLVILIGLGIEVFAILRSK